jgi:hypothetical protein
MSFLKKTWPKKRGFKVEKYKPKKLPGALWNFPPFFFSYGSMGPILKKWLRRNQISIISIELKKGVVVFSSIVGFSIYGLKKWLRDSKISIIWGGDTPFLFSHKNIRK